MNAPRFVAPHVRGVPGWVVAAGMRRASRWFGVDATHALLDAHAQHASRSEAIAAILRSLRVTCDYRGAAEARVPSHGPLLAVANHPFGVLDVLLLHQQVQRWRSDWRLLGLGLWGEIPQAGDALIPVDAQPGAAGGSPGARAVCAALRWLRDGHALAFFPAGVVACWHWRTLRVEEPPWDPLAGMLVRRSSATVVPCAFPGRNSALFQLAAALHPELRHALLLRELHNKRGGRFELRGGAPIAAEAWPGSATARDIARDLRRRVLALRAAPVEHTGVEAEASPSHAVPSSRGDRSTRQRAPRGSVGCP
jgi:putative hemolysin